MAQTLESKLIAQLREIVGKDGVAVGEDEMLVFECDAMTTHRAPPLAVISPSGPEQVPRVVNLPHENRIPFGPRGAGRGLSSGAIATGCKKGDRAVVIEMARMNRILDIDYANRRAV